MPRKDPIIEEIHRVREELAREADYDIEKMIEMAQARQEASGMKGVRLPPRKVEPAKKASWGKRSQRGDGGQAFQRPRARHLTDSYRSVTSS